MSEVDKAVESQADAAIKRGLAGWWAQADEGQKFATAGLTAAAVLGPLGQGILAAFGVLFSEAALPSSKQIAAVFWLFVITLPVAAWILVVVLAVGKMAFPAVLVGAGIAAYLGGQLMSSPSIPQKVGDLYCYASLGSNGVHYESYCRDFDTAGFVSHTYDKVGKPSGSADIFGWAVAYTSDARGSIMVLASIIAAISAGYLIRRAQ